MHENNQRNLEGILSIFFSDRIKYSSIEVLIKKKLESNNGIIKE